MIPASRLYEALEIAYDMTIPNTAHLEVARQLLHRDTVLHRRDRRAAPDDDAGLFDILRDFSNEIWKSQVESIIAGTAW